VTEARNAAGEARWADVYRSGRFGQIVLLAFGVWLHAADELMVSTVTPAMTAEIGGERFIAWLTALYEVGSIVAGAASALVVLRFGLRRAMGSAAFLYLAGCLVSGFAPTMEPMLAGRLIQGLGGGAMIATAFIAVHRIMPGHLTARTYAVISAVWGVSAFSGPMIGAAFADAGWWRGAFFLFAAQAAGLGVLMATRLREPARQISGEEIAAPKHPGWLILRLGFLALGVVLVTASGVEVSMLCSSVLVIAGLALIGLFLRLDGAAGTSRMLPARPWNISGVQGAVLTLVLFTSAATVGLLTYGPLLLTRLHGLDAVTVGFILLLESLGWSVVAVTTSGLPRRLEGTGIAIGFVAVVASVIGLVYAVVAGPVWLIAACAFVQSGGFGLAWAHMVRRATALVQAGEAERTASAIPTVQRLGYALGAAYIGIIANGAGFAEHAGVEVAARTAHSVFGLSLIPAAIGLVAMFRFVSFPERHFRQEARQEARQED